MNIQEYMSHQLHQLMYSRHETVYMHATCTLAVRCHYEQFNILEVLLQHGCDGTLGSEQPRPGERNDRYDQLLYHTELMCMFVTLQWKSC